MQTPHCSFQRTIPVVTLLLFAMLVNPTAFAGQYDPLASNLSCETSEEQFTYDGRTVPIRLYLPVSDEASPVVLLSHGLGGTRESCGYLGRHWASRGYAVIAMQHAGSDVEVIRSASLFRKFQVLKKAANATNAKARYADVKATIDFLETMNRSGERYAGKFDLSKIGMSGHSFGAITTQAVSGQNYSFQGQAHTDKRIDAAVALSPSPPSFGRGDDSFSKVAIPWMLMTGTKDDSPIGRGGDADSRRKVFEGLPSSGHFYELVLDEAEHAAFGDTGRLNARKRNPNHHKAIQSLSTAFWDTYLKQDVSAKEWLRSSDAKSCLEPGDQWQTK